ncbi:MAG: cytochrome c biogenesis CcdA family protein [Candidatus Spechtbacterales bacterium]
MGADVTIWLAFFAGVISFFSPCILPVLPVYLGFLTGNNKGEEASLKRTIAGTGLFVAGFTTVFVALGALAGFFGFFILRELPWLMTVAGIVVVVFGVQMILVALRVSWAEKMFSFLQRTKHFEVRSEAGGGLRSYLMGLAFGFGWTPCIGLVLGGILALAYSSQTAAQGAFLLAVYSLGLGVPFVVAGLFADRVQVFTRKFKKFYTAVQVLSGILLVVFGILIASNNLVWLNAWFYRYIPINIVA